MDGLVVGREDVEGPVRGDVSLQAKQVLLHSVVLVPVLVGNAKVAAVPGERGGGIGARGQDNAQIARDERVGDWNRRQIAKLSQAAAAGGVHRQIDIHELPVRGQPGSQVVVALEEGGLAVDPVQEVDLLSHRHADVARHDQVAIAVSRAAIVHGAGLHEEGSVAVESQVQQRVARA